MGNHAIRTNTTDAYDAVAIAEAPSKPRGQKIHNAAVGYPIHESDGHEDEETDNLRREAEPSTEVPEAVRMTRSAQRHQ